MSEDQFFVRPPVNPTGTPTENESVSADDKFFNSGTKQEVTGPSADTDQVFIPPKSDVTTEQKETTEDKFFVRPSASCFQSSGGASKVGAEQKHVTINPEVTVLNEFSEGSDRTDISKSTSPECEAISSDVSTEQTTSESTIVEVNTISESIEDTKVEAIFVQKKATVREAPIPSVEEPVDKRPKSPPNWEALSNDPIPESHKDETPRAEASEPIVVPEKASVRESPVLAREIKDIEKPSEPSEESSTPKAEPSSVVPKSTSTDTNKPKPLESADDKFFIKRPAVENTEPSEKITPGTTKNETDPAPNSDQITTGPQAKKSENEFIIRPSQTEVPKCIDTTDQFFVRPVTKSPESAANKESRRPTSESTSQETERLPPSISTPKPKPTLTDLEFGKLEFKDHSFASDIELNGLLTGADDDTTAVSNPISKFLNNLMDIPIKTAYRNIDASKTQAEKHESVKGTLDKIFKPSDYKCRFCGVHYAHYTTLKAHERVHNVDAPYDCSKCDQTFRFNAELVSHQQMHDKNSTRGHKCKCGRVFEKYSDFLGHPCEEDGDLAIPSMITTRPSYHSASSYSTSSYLARGDREVTPPESGYSLLARRLAEPLKPYICQFCQKRFSESRELKNHLYIHKNDTGFNTMVKSRYLTTLTADVRERDYDYDY